MLPGYSWKMSAGTSETAPPPAIAADHPGINELFSLLAYGEVAAFYRLTDEARMAPDLRGRINMARMAAAASRPNRHRIASPSCTFPPRGPAIQARPAPPRAPRGVVALRAQI